MDSFPQKRTRAEDSTYDEAQQNIQQQQQQQQKQYALLDDDDVGSEINADHQAKRQRPNASAGLDNTFHQLGGLPHHLLNQPQTTPEHSSILNNIPRQTDALDFSLLAKDRDGSDGEDDDAADGIGMDSEYTSNKKMAHAKNKLVDQETLAELRLAQQGVFLSTDNTKSSSDINNLLNGVNNNDDGDDEDYTHEKHKMMKQQVDALRQQQQQQQQQHDDTSISSSSLSSLTATGITNNGDDEAAQQLAAYQQRMAEFKRTLDREAKSGKFAAFTEGDDDEVEHDDGNDAFNLKTNEFDVHNVYGGNNNNNNKVEKKDKTPEEITTAYKTIINILQDYEQALNDPNSSIANALGNSKQRAKQQSQLLTVDFVVAKLNGVVQYFQTEIQNQQKTQQESTTAQQQQQQQSTDVDTNMTTGLGGAQRKKNVRTKPSAMNNTGTAALFGRLQKEQQPSVAAVVVDIVTLQTTLTKTQENIQQLIDASSTLFEVVDGGVGVLTCDELKQLLARYINTQQQLALLNNMGD